MHKGKLLISLAILALILLPLLGCGAVREVSEPIEKVDCQLSCKRVGLEFYRYYYSRDACECADQAGYVVQIYGVEE